MEGYRVNIRTLPGTGGKVRICWFMLDPAGPAQTPSGTNGPTTHQGVRGRIVCRPHLASVTPQIIAGTTHLLVHSDDGRAVTCPECMATPEWKAWMDLMERGDE